MRDIVDLRDFFARHRGVQELVLCTLVSKRGSSYRAVGAQKIIGRHEGACGLLSGGCLEASIEKTAREGFAQLPFTATFSTLSEEDRLLGYQTGCQGEIELRFERLPPDADLEQVFTLETVRLVIVGCGADADAYQPLAQALGWQIEFIDYRADLAKEDRFPGARVRHVPLDRLARAIPQGPRVAVVLMTHNYEADLEILRTLPPLEVGFVGCLGPQTRFRQMQKDLARLYGEELPADFLARVRAPIGLFPRSRSPMEIALSTIAQIQDLLIERARVSSWCLILAAGAARRFGGPKALAPWRDGTLVTHALKTAREYAGDQVMVVTGAHADRLTSALNETLTVHNPRWEEGMGSSLTAGINAILGSDPSVEHIAVLLVDQPLVTAHHLRALREASHKVNICAMSVDQDGILSAPANIPRAFFSRALNAAGDRGLKSVLAPHEIIPVAAPHLLSDVDRPEDLTRLTTVAQ